LKLAHRELEEARTNATRFIRERIAAAQQAKSGGPSAVRFWQYAVYALHSGLSAQEAGDKFEQMCRRSFEDGAAQERRIERFRRALQVYYDDFSRLNHTVIRTGVRLSLELGPGVNMTGELGRLDLTQDGYAAFLLVKTRPATWNAELRMPLLQAACARRLGVPEELVEVGIYALDTEAHEWRRFSSAEIAEATSEAAQVAARVISAAGTLGYSV
jgi:hypothetical protein